MANKTLFRSTRGKQLPKSDMHNEAGGAAYAFKAEHALAQYAATGCLNSTFYASGSEQLDKILTISMAAKPEFVAQTALYARQKSYMKDMPALLCVVLSVRSPGLLAEVFDRVIDSPKMLRNFVQIMRSGMVGRKSLGTLPKRLVLDWLESRSDEQIFCGSVGNDPSLADIIKMVHPKPKDASRDALYGYLLGREHCAEALPELVKQYEKFKRNTNPGKVPVPDVPFQMLTSLKLSKKEWEGIAKNGSWQMTRMNLNTFARHDVLKNQNMVSMIAKRLRHPELIRRARVFPYQLMVAYAAAKDIPRPIREALQDAMEIAISNVPRVECRVVVCPDVSGSMRSPVTGCRQGATTAVRCVDVAALVAAAMLRVNRDAEVLPFESDVVRVNLNPRDSVMTNAKKLASLPCGGTNCSSVLRDLNRRNAKAELIIYVSDNESWIDSRYYGHWGGGATETMKQWSTFKHRNPMAKMICIDIQPYGHTQAKERDDIINVGGFSDQVFRLIADVADGRASENHWVDQIAAMRL